MNPIALRLAMLTCHLLVGCRSTGDSHGNLAERRTAFEQDYLQCVWLRNEMRTNKFGLGGLYAVNSAYDESFSSLIESAQHYANGNRIRLEREFTRLEEVHGNCGVSWKTFSSRLEE
jgi:hypothetical protein